MTSKTFKVDVRGGLHAICIKCESHSPWKYLGTDGALAQVEFACEKCNTSEIFKLYSVCLGFPNSPLNPHVSEANYLTLQLVRYCKKLEIQAMAGQALAIAIKGDGWERELRKTEEALQSQIDSLYQPTEAALLDGDNLRSALSAFLDKYTKVERRYSSTRLQ